MRCVRIMGGVPSFRPESVLSLGKVRSHFAICQMPVRRFVHLAAPTHLDCRCYRVPCPRLRVGMLARSRLHNGAVAPPQVAPAAIERRTILDREPRCNLLIDVDAEPGLIVGPVVTILQLRAAGEYVFFRLRE